MPKDTRGNRKRIIAKDLTIIPMKKHISEVPLIEIITRVRMKTTTRIAMKETNRTIQKTGIQLATKEKTKITKNK
jgi:hypothetical protein